MFTSENHSRVAGDTPRRYKSSDLLIQHLPEGQEWTQGLRRPADIVLYIYICIYILG